MSTTTKPNNDAAKPTTQPKPKKISIQSSDVKKSKSKYTGEKAIPRCTSPSHFLTPEPVALQALQHTTQRSHIDALLNSIGQLYYHNSTTAITHVDGSTIQNEQLWVSNEYNKTEYNTLDQLLSPLRQSSVLDNWCLREIALFETGICAVGKNFHEISKLIQSKTTNECIEFYYVWKKSSHYYMWKYYGKNTIPIHPAKHQQIQQINDKLNNTNNTIHNNNNSKPLNISTTDLRQSPVSSTESPISGADDSSAKRKANKLNKRNSADDLNDLSKKNKTNNNTSSAVS